MGPPGNREALRLYREVLRTGEWSRAARRRAACGQAAASREGETTLGRWGRRCGAVRCAAVMSNNACIIRLPVRKKPFF
jgi:hypothetical protein